MDGSERNQTMETIMSRHSVREFTGEKVGRDTLETLLRAAMAAPSAVNVQPWSFLAITDGAILAKLESRLPYAKMLGKAGSAIVVCGLPGKDETFAKQYWQVDCAAAAENILLAAHALGLGAVWTAVHPDPERIRSVRETCGIPESVVPLAVIPVGVPAKPDYAPRGKYRSENVHWDRW